jgi:hypothetical protein
MKYHARSVALVLALFGLLASGCSTVTVGKSKMRPLSVQASQTLRLKFWKLDFTVTSLAGELEIKGVAYPNRDRLPEWADWTELFKLTAYLCDANGLVLASDEMNYQPHALNPTTGAPFRFSFKKDSKTAAATNLTFGYQSRITARDRKGQEPKEFFASEPAMVRY